MHFVIDDLLFYGGGEGISTIGNPLDVTRVPIIKNALANLRDIVLMDYLEIKNTERIHELHEGWGDFKQLQDIDCNIPKDQAAILDKIKLNDDDATVVDNQEEIVEHNDTGNKCALDIATDDFDDGLDSLDIVLPEKVYELSQSDLDLVDSDELLFTQPPPPTMRPSSPIFGEGFSTQVSASQNGLISLMQGLSGCLLTQNSSAQQPQSTNIKMSDDLDAILVASPEKTMDVVSDSGADRTMDAGLQTQAPDNVGDEDSVEGVLMESLGDDDVMTQANDGGLQTQLPESMTDEILMTQANDGGLQTQALESIAENEMMTQDNVCEFQTQANDGGLQTQALESIAENEMMTQDNVCEFQTQTSQSIAEVVVATQASEHSSIDSTTVNAPNELLADKETEVSNLSTPQESIPNAVSTPSMEPQELMTKGNEIHTLAPETDAAMSQLPESFDLFTQAPALWSDSNSKPISFEIDDELMDHAESIMLESQELEFASQNLAEVEQCISTQVSVQFSDIPSPASQSSDSGQFSTQQVHGSVDCEVSDQASDGMSFTSETSCSFIFENPSFANLKPKGGLEEDDEQENLPEFSLQTQERQESTPIEQDSSIQAQETNTVQHAEEVEMEVDRVIVEDNFESNTISVPVLPTVENQDVGEETPLVIETAGSDDTEMLATVERLPSPQNNEILSSNEQVVENGICSEIIIPINSIANEDSNVAMMDAGQLPSAGEEMCSTKNGDFNKSNQDAEDFAIDAKLQLDSSESIEETKDILTQELPAASEMHFSEILSVKQEMQPTFESTFETVSSLGVAPTSEDNQESQAIHSSGEMIEESTLEPKCSELESFDNAVAPAPMVHKPLLFMGIDVGAGGKLVQQDFSNANSLGNVLKTSTPKNPFKGVQNAASPLWSQMHHSHPEDPSTPIAGSLKLNITFSTPNTNADSIHTCENGQRARKSPLIDSAPAPTPAETLMVVMEEATVCSGEAKDSITMDLTMSAVIPESESQLEDSQNEVPMLSIGASPSKSVPEEVVSKIEVEKVSSDNNIENHGSTPTNKDVKPKKLFISASLQKLMKQQNIDLPTTIIQPTVKKGTHMLSAGAKKLFELENIDIPNSLVESDAVRNDEESGTNLDGI